MANRMTTYGYGYIDGKLSVIESEAEIVRRVFKEYCNGAILSLRSSMKMSLCTQIS